MIYEEITLGVGNAALHVYKPDKTNKNEAILVIPGGGYGAVCTDREGEPIALSYLSKGFTAFVLKYSVGEAAPINCPLAEASAAVAYIRRNKDKYGICPDRVYAVGFSAGGHLCGSLGALWHRDEIVKKAGIEYGENKPNGVVLCYPVITGGEKAHKDSFYNLIGTTEPTEEQLDYYSLEKHVDERSAPAFIIHTAEDELVPVHNSLMMATAYANAKVPFELHVYPHGPHGMALGNAITANGNLGYIDKRYERWVDDSISFFRGLK